MELSKPDKPPLRRGKSKPIDKVELILGKLSTKTMFMYSLPQFPVVCMSVTIYVYLVTMYIIYYVDGVGNLLSVIIIAMTVTQPIAGSMVGSSGEFIQISKFKRYFLYSLLMLGVGYMFLIFLPMALSEGTRWILYIVSTVIGIGWGIYEIAFAAIGSNLSTNYDVRINLQAWATFLYATGILFSHLLHGVFDNLLNYKNGILHRHYILAPLFFVMLIISLVLFQLYVNISEDNLCSKEFKEMLRLSMSIEQPKLTFKERLLAFKSKIIPFFKDYYRIISNRNAIAMTLVDTSNSIFATISGFVLCLAAKQFLGMPKFESFAPLTTYLAMSIILPIWFKIRDYFNPEKKISILIALISESIGIILILYTVKTGYLAGFITILTIFGFSHGIFLTTVQSLNGDVVDYGHAKNNKRTEGDLFGFVYFIKNGVAALALKLYFYFLGIYGFTGKEEEKLTPDVLSAVKLITLIIYGATYSISYTALAIYNIDRKYHMELVADILRKSLSRELSMRTKVFNDV